MRKYFLLSVVGLLATTSANADTTVGTVPVNAVIKNSTQVSCSEMNFGEIYIPVNNAQGSVILPPDTNMMSAFFDSRTYEGGVHAVGGTPRSARCDVYSALTFDDGSSTPNNVALPTTAVLSNSAGTNSLLLGNFTIDMYNDYDTGVDDELSIGGTLMIPEKTPAGEYTGSFSVMVTVE